MSNPYRDRLLGVQVAARGITPDVRERVTIAPDGHRVRELRETETNASVYHYSNDDSRQDVTHRPSVARIRISREDK